MSVWVALSLCIGIAAALAAAVWMGRRLEKNKSAKTVSEAQARMAEHRDSSDSASTDRLSDGRY